MDKLYFLLIDIEKDFKSFDRFHEHVKSCRKQITKGINFGFIVAPIDVFLPENIRSYNDTMINKIKSVLKKVIEKNQNINNGSLKIINENDYEQFYSI